MVLVNVHDVLHHGIEGVAKRKRKGQKTITEQKGLHDYPEKQEGAGKGYACDVCGRKIDDCYHQCHNDLCEECCRAWILSGVIDVGEWKKTHKGKDSRGRG